MRLESYDPFLGPGPYSGPGPIFLHEEGCEAYEDDGAAVPDQLQRRLLSFRAYDARHMMAAAEIADGVKFSLTATNLLAYSNVAYLHVHYARPGCFAVRVHRAGEAVGKAAHPASRAEKASRRVTWAVA